MKRNALGLAVLVLLMGCGRSPTTAQDARIQTPQLAPASLAGQWQALNGQTLKIDSTGSVEANGCSEAVTITELQDASGCAANSSLCMSGRTNIGEALVRSGCLHTTTPSPCLFQILNAELTITCQVTLGPVESMTYSQ